MLEALEQFLHQKWPGSILVDVRLIQDLWANLGTIQRLHIENAPVSNVVVKCFQWDAPNAKHPRGWDSSIGYQRKKDSYIRETAFYSQIPSQVAFGHAQYFGHTKGPQQLLLFLEDFSLRTPAFDVEAGYQEAVLQWLAQFHAYYLVEPSPFMQHRGNYWHLKTRGEEFNRLELGTLKTNAPKWDDQLDAAPFQTLIHGDAKAANFAFDGESVLGYDFQYVGRGIGLVDVVYYLGSVWTDEGLHQHYDQALERYFHFLDTALQKHCWTGNFKALLGAWTGLESVVWADFHRFLSGWAPDHYKLGTFSQMQLERALLER